MAVAAPAGYGKTSSLLLWAAADERPFAWVQLTAADNDPVHLGRHVALALDTVRAGRRAPPRPPPGSGPLRRSRHLSHRGPHAGGASADRARARRHPPPDWRSQRSVGSKRSAPRVAAGSQIAIAGRHLPLRMGREHMRGHVFDLGVEDLAMDAAEAQLLFEQANLELSEIELGDLVERTEGWPGGLHLATLVLEPGHTAQAFSGRDRLVGRLPHRRGPRRDERRRRSTSSSAPPRSSTWMPTCSTPSSSAPTPERCSRRSRRAATCSSCPWTTKGTGTAITTCSETSCNADSEPTTRRLAQRLESRASLLLERTGDPDGAVRHAVNAHEDERAANLILGATFARLVRWSLRPDRRMAGAARRRRDRPVPGGRARHRLVRRRLRRPRAHRPRLPRRRALRLVRTAGRRISLPAGRTGNGAHLPGRRRRRRRPPRRRDRPGGWRPGLELLVGLRHRRTRDGVRHAGRARPGPDAHRRGHGGNARCAVHRSARARRISRSSHWHEGDLAEAELLATRAHASPTVITSTASFPRWPSTRSPR